MNQRKTHRETAQHRAGLTLVEVVFSTMLVGFVLVGAMDLLGAVVRGRTSNTEGARAEQLAHQLMAEILKGNYQDDSTPLFGLEAGETAGVRASYDDVDDYNNWAPATVADLDGSTLVNTTGWKREVTVELVNPANPAALSSELGVKRITITIKHNGREITRLVALRTNKYTVP